MSDKIEPVAWLSKIKQGGILEVDNPEAPENAYWFAAFPVYTADALAQARAEALEDGAKFCDDVYERSASRDDGEDRFEDGIKWATETIASRLRSMKEQKK
jgi:hypothetical protein